MSNIIVTGSSSGLGKALVEELQLEGHHVFRYDLIGGWNVLFPPRLLAENFQVDVLINCAGINKLNWLEDVSEKEWQEMMDVNVKGILKMSQACLAVLRKRRGTILNIVSNAASVPMRCSAAYNASKAAALMLSKQMARELSDDGITVFSISPNRLSATGMSDSVDDQVSKLRGWPKKEVEERQTASLLVREQTPPVCVAKFIAFLLKDKENHKYLAGCDLPYGA